MLVRFVLCQTVHKRKVEGGGRAVDLISRVRTVPSVEYAPYVGFISSS